MNGSKFTMFVGTYTNGDENNNGIHVFEINGSGELKKTGESDRINNPSYLAAENGFLYAVMEEFSPDGARTGGVAAYKINKAKNQIEYINRKLIDQRGACHLAVSRDKKYIAAANYGDGSVTLIKRDEDGLLGGVCDIYNLNGTTGPNKNRQTQSHVHYAMFRNERLYVTDLGTDRVFCFEIKNEKLITDEKRSFSVKPGGGPRHLAQTKDFIYCVNELTSDVSVFKEENDSFAEIQTIGMLDVFDSPNTAAAIRISPDEQYLYASNRGHDSVAAYKIDAGGRLALICITKTEGMEPRDFNITPDGRFLIAANQNSDTLAVFKLNGGRPKYAGIKVTVPKPVCVLFI